MGDKMQNKRCLIIYNPISGKGISDKVLSSYDEILRENGYDVDIVKTEYSNHAMETMAEAAYYDIVFSIGGDGTLNEVVKGNYMRDKKLIICPLPSGTCNDVASMLGYGKNPVHNLNMALSGAVNYIDIGMINNSPFTYVVGMGKLMNIPYETKGKDKQKEGYLAYVKGALGEAINKMKRYRAKVNVDGVENVEVVAFASKYIKVMDLFSEKNNYVLEIKGKKDKNKLILDKVSVEE